MLETIKTKKCHKCKIVKEETEFSKNKTKKDGLQTKCKVCCNIARKSTTEYYQKYYKENKELYSDTSTRYYKDNREKILLHRKNYSKTEQGKAVIKNKNHKRRSKEKHGDVITNKLLELQNNAKFCYWCNITLKNKKVHIDHYVPLAKGGEHTISNLVISCAQCNLKKNSKDPVIFANSIGKLL